MPLITITCSSEYYPRDDILGLEPTPEQALVIGLADGLPSLININAAGLGLNPGDTPENDVRIDIRKFHSRAVNAPDIQIQVQFTEPYPHKNRKSASRLVRATFTDKVNYLVRENWRVDESPWCKIDIDLLWGPGHGCTMSPAGKVTHAW